MDPRGGIDLSGDKTDWFNVSYDVLTRGLVSWIDTRNGNEANILEIAPYRWGSPASKLTGLLLAGHPDAAGNRRVSVEAESLARVLTWIDLNAPYYGTYEVDDASAPGGRRHYPPGLDGKLGEVWSRRCASCHAGKKATPGFVRITSPELNPFLSAPLAREAGGRGACRPAVYLSKEDPDYRSILDLFEPLRKSLESRPRMDMPGGKAALVSKSRL
jgi:hypothetical protein